MATVARNTVLFTAALVVQKCIAVTYFVILARHLDAPLLGRYAVAIAFPTLFAVLIDWGLNSYLVRAIAQKHERVAELIGEIIGWKCVAGVATYGAMLAIAYAFGYRGELLLLVTITGLAMVVDVATQALWSIWRGHEQLQWESRGNIIFQLTLLAVGSAILTLYPTLPMLTGALLTASLANFTLALISLRQLPTRFRLTLRWRGIPPLLLASLPFALAAIAARVYASVDVILLNHLSGEHAAGFYTAAAKLVASLQFIPSALSAALYPRFSSLMGDASELDRSFTHAFRYLLMISLPVSVGGLVSAQPIIELLYGSRYLPAVATLQVSALGILFLFLNYPAGAFLSAMHRQWQHAASLSAVALVDILLNLVLIPRYGSLGAAIAFTVSAFQLLLVNYALAHRAGLRLRSLWGVSARLIAATLGMAAVNVLLIRLGLPSISVIVVTGLSYALLLWLCGAIGSADLQLIRNQLRRS